METRASEAILVFLVDGKEEKPLVCPFLFYFMFLFKFLKLHFPSIKVVLIKINATLNSRKFEEKYEKKINK